MPLFSRAFLPLLVLLLPVYGVEAGAAPPTDDSTNTGSEYGVGVGGTLLTTAHTRMMGLSAAYTWNGQHLHLTGRFTYRRTPPTRGVIAETDTRTALMVGLHRFIGNRRLSVSAGVGTVSGKRYSGISLFGVVPLPDHFVGMGVPLEVNATLGRVGTVRFDLSMFGFLQVTTSVGERRGSALGVGITARFEELF